MEPRTIVDDLREIIEEFKKLKALCDGLCENRGIMLCGVDDFGKKLHVYNGIATIATEIGAEMEIEPFIKKDGSAITSFLLDDTRLFQVVSPRGIDKPAE